MKIKITELFEKITTDTIESKEFIKLIKFEIGGDKRTQEKYFEFCIEFGIVTPDKKNLDVFLINHNITI